MSSFDAIKLLNDLNNWCKLEKKRIFNVYGALKLFCNGSLTLLVLLIKFVFYNLLCKICKLNWTLLLVVKSLKFKELNVITLSKSLRA